MPCSNTVSTGHKGRGRIKLSEQRVDRKSLASGLDAVYDEERRRGSIALSERSMDVQREMPWNHTHSTVLN